MFLYKKIIYFLLYWITYSALIGRYIYDNEIINFIPDVLILLLYIWKPKGLNYSSSIRFWGKSILYLTNVFFLFCIIGGFINFVPIHSFLWGCRMLLRYIFLFIVIYRCFDIKDVFKYKQFIYKWFNINFLFCIIQFLQGYRQDFMGGTFAGNGLLVLMLFISMIIFSGDYFQKKLSLKNFLFRVIITFIIVLWAELKIAYFVIPLIIYGSYVLLRKINLTHLIILIIASFVLIPSMKFFMSFYYDKDYVEQVFDPNYIKEETSHAYGFRDGFNRSTAISMTNELMLTDIKKTLFGYGLGSGSTSSYFMTEIYKEWDWTSYSNFSTSYILVELGWIGFILYILIYFVVLIKFYSFYRNSKNTISSYWATSGILAVFVSFVMLWYNDNAYFKFYLMYFFWAISVIVLSKNISVKNKYDKNFCNNSNL